MSHTLIFPSSWEENKNSQQYDTQIYIWGRLWETYPRGTSPHLLMDAWDDSSVPPLFTSAIVFAPSSLLAVSRVAAAAEDEAESPTSTSEPSTGALSKDKPSSVGLKNALFTAHNWHLQRKFVPKTQCFDLIRLKILSKSVVHFLLSSPTASIWWYYSCLDILKKEFGMQGFFENLTSEDLQTQYLHPLAHHRQRDQYGPGWGPIRGLWDHFHPDKKI